MQKYDILCSRNISHLRPTPQNTCYYLPLCEVFMLTIVLFLTFNCVILKNIVIKTLDIIVISVSSCKKMKALTNLHLLIQLMVWLHYHLTVKCSVKKQQKLFNIYLFFFIFQLAYSKLKQLSYFYMFSQKQ